MLPYYPRPCTSIVLSSPYARSHHISSIPPSVIRSPSVVSFLLVARLSPNPPTAHPPITYRYFLIPPSMPPCPYLFSCRFPFPSLWSRITDSPPPPFLYTPHQIVLHSNHPSLLVSRCDSLCTLCVRSRCLEELLFVALPPASQMGRVVHCDIVTHSSARVIVRNAS
jgi:hypothetical protein